jgi:hypothetical protein
LDTRIQRGEVALLAPSHAPDRPLPVAGEVHKRRPSMGWVGLRRDQAALEQGVDQLLYVLPGNQTAAGYAGHRGGAVPVEMLEHGSHASADGLLGVQVLHHGRGLVKQQPYLLQEEVDRVVHDKYAVITTSPLSNLTT